ncbi:MAG: helix-turn-helix transcriptional regulator [Firmicutes bacterium]|nr:helix-turn-helix transcriptional regulator [Bacillota bacterium]
MAIGERIHFFRNFHNITQKQLGQMLGFPERSADVRIAQYESGKRTPKEDTINQLAHILNVSPMALDVPNIDNYYGLMHTLFALEDMYGLTITNLDGQICLKQDVNHPNYNLTLASDLIEWNKVKTQLTTGSITTAEYNQWRYSYPERKK